MQKKNDTRRESSFALKLLGFFCLITSIAVAPNILYDPINSPKSFFLIVFGLLITLLWISKSKEYSLKGTKIGKFFPFLCLFYFLALLAPIFLVRDLSITRQILGDFGRLNGFGSSFALLLVMLFSLDSARRNETLGSFFFWFKIAGYATLLYSIFQILQLDPLKWSGPGTIGFLGNLNFNSAFLGLFSIYCLWNLATHAALSQKSWWASLVILNLSIIYQSGSLQGLIVFGVGAISLLRMFSGDGKRGMFFRTGLRKSIQSIGAIGIFLGLLGTLNIGPLNFLTQQTMLFRLDYWSAGIRMFLSYPWTGVGLDSYGRYYREFRDETAAYRTSPDRITNVSHNVFIDQFVSGGIFLGITFILFFLYALLKVTLSIRLIETCQGKDKAVPTEVLLLRALLIGYIFQLLVSINQIGLAIWGWALLGLTIGTCLRVKISNDSAKSQSDEKYGTLKPWVIRSAELVAITLGAFSLVAITNYVKGDFEFRKAYQARDYSTMWNIVEQHRLQPFFGEIALKFAGDAGDYEFISTKSKILIKIDERNYFAWLAQIALPGSTAIERQNAVEELGNLDPFNPEARDLFEGVTGSSPSN